jgi:hypothetical protein
MEELTFEQFEMDLFESESIFNKSICDTELYAYTESVKDITAKIKSVISKFVNALHAYTENVKRIIELYKTKRGVERNLKVIERAIKKCPEISKEKIHYRIFYGSKDDVDYYSKITNNLAYRIENLDSEWITTIIDNYYKNIDCTDENLKDISIQAALKNTEAVIEGIEEEINETYKCIRHVSSAIEKSKNLNNKHASLFKKAVQSIQKGIQRKVYMIFLNIEYLFSCIHSRVVDLVKKDSKEYVIKRISRENTAIKHSKKIDTVEILGYKIELYETDRYIQSEFVTGSNNNPKIYLGKRFKELPRPHQLATLYHEFGHVINGHLGANLYRNEYKLSKTIKRRARKYLNVMNAPMTDENKKILSDDDVLVYLLIELEADEFASKVVGKRVMKKTLEKDYKQLVRDAKRVSDEAKAGTLLAGKARTKML